MDKSESKLSQYVFVQKCACPSEPDAHSVIFKVGPQQFVIGREASETKDDAEWFASMFVHAMETACGRAAPIAAPTSADSQEREATWQPITKPGQVKVGDKLRFELCGESKTHTVKLVLDAGTDREEIIYHKANNWYVITSNAIAGMGSQKNVEFLPKARADLAAPKQPELTDAQILQIAADTGLKIRTGQGAIRFARAVLAAAQGEKSDGNQ